MDWPGKGVKIVPGEGEPGGMTGCAAEDTGSAALCVLESAGRGTTGPLGSAETRLACEMDAELSFLWSLSSPVVWTDCIPDSTVSASNLLKTVWTAKAEATTKLESSCIVSGGIEV